VPFPGTTGAFGRRGRPADVPGGAEVGAAGAGRAGAATAAAALSVIWPGTVARAEMASRVRDVLRPGNRTSPRASCATNHAGR
jgi:hypothetical protein